MIDQWHTDAKVQNKNKNKGEPNTMKRYMNISLLYAILAMVGGVFYREFTKFNGFTGKTALGVVHTHYFLLGMIFFLLDPVGKKLCLYQRKDRTDPGCLSHWTEPDRCNVCRAGHNPSTWYRAFLWYECGNSRDSRNWPYTAGGQSDPAVDPN